MELKKFLTENLHYSLVDGKSIYGQGEMAVDFITPITGNPWKQIIPVTGKEVNESISIAQQAFTKWSRVPAFQRAEMLRKVAALILENMDLLINTMTMEMGKTSREGRSEVIYSAGFFSWFAGEAERTYGKIIPSHVPNKNLKVFYEPIGVCGIITPWNFPLAMPARKIAAALAAGCTIVAKPSPETPFTMLLLAKICHMAGIPTDALNVVIGPEKEIGNSLLNSSSVRKISFTGSSDVGKYLYMKSGMTLKKLTLELGGHAPLIVFDDANIDCAVRETIVAKFRNSGQTCIAANRIIVQDKIYDKFLERFIASVKDLKVGDPFSETTDISNILHPISVVKVNEQIDDALCKGAKVEYLTKKIYEPKIISDVTPGMKIFREETFGPIASITKFSTLEEAIVLANSSEYGLTAYVFTESMKKAAIAVSQLEYGIIGVNDGLPSTPQGSFGGIKSSGLGREGGPSGIYEYLTEKFVSIAF